MYFLYADESGQTKIKRNSQDNGLYILSGVLVHEKDWRSVEKKLADVKQYLFPRHRPGEWELHAQEIWNSKEFFAKEDLRLNLAKKEEIFSRVVETACESEIVIINVIVFKDRLGRRLSSAVMKSSWRRLTGRFEYFLRQRPNRADDGLFFIDSSQKTPQTEIENAILGEVRRRGNRLGSRHVIENPIFVESDRWNLIQLADMVAYVVHRHCRKDARFERWFKLLEPKMYHSGGRIRGFGINEIPDSLGREAGPHSCGKLLP
ncbi:MAG: DUF3800 domain-containing protein [Nitrosopumilaceae archaeon]|nr:DUF3800 domain-containing protein [Nitrosopumilaceae archaeon]